MAMQSASSRSWRAARPLILALSLACCAAVPEGRAQAAATPEACPAPSSATVVPATPNTVALVPAAAQIVVCVHDLPILGATYIHWAEVAEKTGGTKPKHPATARELTEEVLGFLISSNWLLEEAHRLHIAIPARTVRHTFEHIRNQQFPKRGEFSAFMKSSGQTVADLELRIKLNLLSKKMLAQVQARQHSKRAKQRALVNFVKGFKGRWRSDTYCTSEYAVADCGHIVAPPL